LKQKSPLGTAISLREHRPHQGNRACMEHPPPYVSQPARLTQLASGRHTACATAAARKRLAATIPGGDRRRLVLRTRQPLRTRRPLGTLRPASAACSVALGRPAAALDPAAARHPAAGGSRSQRRGVVASGSGGPSGRSGPCIRPQPSATLRRGGQQQRWTQRPLGTLQPATAARNVAAWRPAAALDPAAARDPAAGGSHPQCCGVATSSRSGPSGRSGPSSRLQPHATSWRGDRPRSVVRTALTSPPHLGRAPPHQAAHRHPGSHPQPLREKNVRPARDWASRSTE
jgi:hypothetical protein